jgi:hypothetical protein
MLVSIGRQKEGIKKQQKNLCVCVCEERPPPVQYPAIDFSINLKGIDGWGAIK